MRCLAVQTATAKATFKCSSPNLSGIAQAPPGNFARHGDVLYSMQYAFNYCRSGIFVSIRDAKIQLFVPFCNAQYVNTWSENVRHSFAPSRTGLPPCNWWMNGWMLCDEIPEQVWGDHWVTAIRNMVRNCCVVDCDFIINKRDCPLVRKDCGDPMNPFDPATKVVDPKRLVRFSRSRAVSS